MKRRKYPSHEVLIELHYTSGRSVRVVAIDPETGTEVTTVGDSKRGEEELKRVAANKLRYVLNKKRKAKESENDLF
jgi:hypothetical protein